MHCYERGSGDYKELIAKRCMQYINLKLKPDTELMCAIALGKWSNPVVRTVAGSACRHAEGRAGDGAADTGEVYLANKPEDSGWVVLPVKNFDACFGTTSFSRKRLARLPESALVRGNGYGVCRYRMFVQQFDYSL